MRVEVVSLFSMRRRDLAFRVKGRSSKEDQTCFHINHVAIFIDEIALVVYFPSHSVHIHSSLISLNHDLSVEVSHLTKDVILVKSPSLICWRDFFSINHCDIILGKALSRGFFKWLNLILIEFIVNCLLECFVLSSDLVSESAI